MIPNAQIPNSRGLLKKTDYKLVTTSMHIKVTKIENKQPDITNLGTKAAMNAKVVEVKSKIPNIINLDTGAALNTKATEIKKKKIPDTISFITTPRFSR